MPPTSSPPFDPVEHHRQRTRQTELTGHCILCGDPARGSYCHAHSWAAGALKLVTRPR